MEAEVNGVRLHYELAGNGEKRIVLLHGWGCDGSLMAPVARALTGDARVLTVDFPAHGKSGRPPQPWGVPEFAACLRELLLRLDFLPCGVVAHSFGGRVTILLAAEHPEMFTRLVLTGRQAFAPSPRKQPANARKPIVSSKGFARAPRNGKFLVRCRSVRRKAFARNSAPETIMHWMRKCGRPL